MRERGEVPGFLFHISWQNFGGTKLLRKRWVHRNVAYRLGRVTCLCYLRRNLPSFDRDGTIHPRRSFETRFDTSERQSPNRERCRSHLCFPSSVCREGGPLLSPDIHLLLEQVVFSVLLQFLLLLSLYHHEDSGYLRRKYFFFQVF